MIDRNGVVQMFYEIGFILKSSFLCIEKKDKKQWERLLR
jgi:hypothetical protein